MYVPISKYTGTKQTWRLDYSVKNVYKTVDYTSDVNKATTPKAKATTFKANVRRSLECQKMPQQSPN